MIEAYNLEKKYFTPQETISVLKGIDLLIEKDDALGIFGPSGSGKSTLLHILSGLDRPTKGQVIFAGVNISNLNEQELFTLRNQKFGFVFQFHYLLPEFTVLENVAFPLFIRGRPFSEALKKAKNILEELEIIDKIKLYPQQLSGGERQKVNIARALVGEPECLFLDEPTGNLDYETQELILELLKRVHKNRGKAMVIVSHNERIKDYVKRWFYLIEGKLYESKKLAEFKK